MELTIEWDKAVKVKDGGIWKYRREWFIPAEFRSGFFNWWKLNKFSMLTRGFTVVKKDEEWFLVETKPSISQFEVLGSFAKKKELPPDDNFVLVPSEVKNTSGLRPWQVNAVGSIVASLKQWGCAVDGSDLGVGKTYTSCGVARELDYNIVVICPKAVKESWKRVICNHFKMSDKLLGIINYELLIRGKKESDIASFIRNKKTNREEFVWKLPKNTLIVWDESQKLKNWKTKNSKTCLAAFKQGYPMLFCSATVATNPLELRTIGTCLKLFKGAKQYYEWVYAHGVEKGPFGLFFDKDDVNNEKFLKKLNKDIFEKRGTRLCRDTIPNFPESEIIADCYNMDEQDVASLNQIYSEMSKELKLLEKIEKKDGNSHLTISLRARQKTELVKVPLFIEMIEEGIEQGMSVVLFVNFTETINAISKRLNTNCIFDGKISDKIRQKNVDDFQADKERVILVNIQSGGAGLSLHDINGKYPRLSLISPTWSAVYMRQATGRVWRDSAKSKSIQKIVFVADTIEEDVCKSVQSKLNNLDILNDGDLSYDRKENEIING
jgi:superfamily II DNA or RNA helicase